MLHTIPVEQLGPRGTSMSEAVSSCVHCGFCLPDCPTYRVLGEEMDSPRGRIFLMKDALEEKLPLAEVLPYIDRCLGCVGCVTACPSGVEYGDLITSFRAWSNEQRRRTIASRVLRTLVLKSLPYPGRFRIGVKIGQFAKPFRRLLPSRLRAMLDLLPDTLPKPAPLPEFFPAIGKRRARVALLAGCAQQVLSPQINWATLRVLARNGVEVVIPRNQQCCGALAAHTGAMSQAVTHARHNLGVFPSDVDAIITNAAGCGSGMREYGLWFQGQAEEVAAKEMADRVQDISEFLVQLGTIDAPPLSAPMKVAYHEACHLVHAQGVSDQPKKLLNSIPNLELVYVPEGQICCGSAGAYNIEQPSIAHQLGTEKAQSILATGAVAVAAGNIGCMTQIAVHLKLLGHQLPVYHTVELLDRSYSSLE
ncbi:MAG: 4Fe-4S dicluster domain-containing protein [Planctomycetes bacterium]|nr:4Fe-4S dicluster domain-containing protein [Planctomycetota bacterium]